MIASSRFFFEALAASAIAKVAIFFIAWGLLWLPIAVPLANVLNWRPSQPLTPQQKLPLVLSLYVLAPFLLWGAARIEQVPFTEYGLTWSAATGVGIVLGIGLAVVGVGLLVGLETLLGWIRWKSADLQSLLVIWLSTLGLGLLISLIEELVFRGFLVNQLQQEFSLVSAAAGSSLIFALLHLVWNGKETIPQLPGLWLMGMVLVLARWGSDGNLGLAIGLHAGWVWVIASLDTAQLIHPTDRNQPWLTGFQGQPLAGALGLLLLLATAGVIFWGLAPTIS